MAEPVLQISSHLGNIRSVLLYLIRAILSSRNLSFIHVSVNIARCIWIYFSCMFTYLGFCGVCPFLFFLSLFVSQNTLVEMHVLFLIRQRLIIVSFLFSWGIRLTRLTILRSRNSFKGEFFFLFSQCSLRVMTLEFGFLLSTVLYCLENAFFF